MFRNILTTVTKFRIPISNSVTKRNLSRSVLLRSDEKNSDKSEKDKDSSKKEEPKEEQFILVEREGPITLFGINRPEQRNAINSLAAKQLCEAIDKFETDETSTVGVLYGVGGSFCSGYDINELIGKDSEDVNTDILMQAEGSVGPTRRHIKKPLICGISGYCVANGLELALMCDLRVMEESAILGFFNRRYGVPVIDAGTVRLPAMIGISRALDLILTGRQLAAKEAFEFGIANRIVATGTALGQAVNLANCIAKFPQASLNHDRNSLYAAVYDSQNFDTSVQNEIMYMSKEVLDEMKTGIAKFHAGIGRTGSTTDIKEKSMADWEKEEICKENEKPIMKNITESDSPKVIDTTTKTETKK